MSPARGCLSVLLVVTALAAARPARAQALAPADDSGEGWRNLQARYEEGRSFRGAGIVLTIAGAALVGLGVPVYLADPGNEGFPSRTLGGIILAGGGVALVSGIGVWIYGAHRMNEARSLGYATAWRPFVAPTRGGAMAGISIVAF